MENISLDFLAEYCVINGYCGYFAVFLWRQSHLYVHNLSKKTTSRQKLAFGYALPRWTVVFFLRSPPVMTDLLTRELGHLVWPHAATKPPSESLCPSGPFAGRRARAG